MKSCKLLFLNLFDLNLNEDTYRSSIYRVVEESRHKSRIGWQAGSPHYFSAVEYCHAYLVKIWLALVTLRSKHNLPKSRCLSEQASFVKPAYVENIPFSMQMDA